MERLFWSIVSAGIMAARLLGVISVRGSRAQRVCAPE